MAPRWVPYIFMSLGIAALGIGCGEAEEIEPEVPVEEMVEPDAEREQMMRDRQTGSEIP